MSALDSALNIQDHHYHSGFFKSIYETAIDGVIIIDKTGIIHLVNASAATLFGYPKEEIVGKNVNILMPEPHNHQHDQYIQNHLDTGEKKIIGIGREVLGLKKNGELFPLRLAVSKFEIKDKIYFTGIIHDLSAQKEAEKNLWYLNKNLEKLVESRTSQLQESLNQLNEINKNLEFEIAQRKLAETKLLAREAELVNALEKEMNLHLLKSRFISVASHEFRTPLATILSSLSLIDKYHQESQLEQRNKHIQKIKSNIHYLNGILNEFLSLTRFEEGKFNLKIELFSLRGFIQELVEDFNYLKKNDQILLFSARIEMDDYEIHSDKTCIRHILSNLISNAIKYSGDNAEIKVSLFKEATEFIVEIQDNGIGIPKEEQKFIFDIFYRASNVLNIQGTGLGLNIVKKYLDSIGGMLKFESEENKGTRIIIRLGDHEH
ncbi:MAG: PAS domain-containing sensor histidine kinase [Saprospiraceae bacterium]|nr:PAS domain-containing sensor histidine kinase [Saprospiraceae bacterium]